jgi:hypothetical protein
MKMRRAWLLIWSDGTEWYGDCEKWAFAYPLRNGTTRKEIRVLRMRGKCGYCGEVH